MSYKMTVPFKHWPHEIIGPTQRPLMIRYFILPKNKYFNIYLHKLCRPDSDRDLHDHPWWSLAIVLRGYYKEEGPGGFYFYNAGNFKFRRATYKHRIDFVSYQCWTLFITGPVVRKWGFITKSGWWVPWKEYINGR